MVPTDRIASKNEGGKFFPKLTKIYTRLHGITSQTSASFTVTVMRISDHIFNGTALYLAI